MQSSLPCPGLAPRARTHLLRSLHSEDGGSEGAFLGGLRVCRASSSINRSPQSPGCEAVQRGDVVGDTARRLAPYPLHSPQSHF